MRRKWIWAAGLAAAMAGPALAHHSFAMIDSGKTVTLTGTVRSLEMILPHSWLQITVTTRGRPVNWALEMGDPAQLTRQGWTPQVVKAGDRVSVTIHPRMDGSNAGQLMSMKLPDGRELEADKPAGR